MKIKKSMNILNKKRWENILVRDFLNKKLQLKDLID